ncbi:MAG TPA: MmgE/PrpD family protein, partial [Kiritimatiellia bacterium]
MSSHVSNVRPPPDDVLAQIADYVLKKDVASGEAMETARLCLVDSLGCALLALKYPECTKMLGPVVPGMQPRSGCRVPRVEGYLDPVAAAFNWGLLIRWLDFNDTWLAAEWGHPSDNFGGLLALGEHLKLTVRDVLDAAVKA